MPKTKEQNEQLKKERIDSIYRAALYLFATRGFNGVTSDDITNAAKCSHGLLYHYFGSKEELFQHLINDIVLKLDEEITKDVDFTQRPKFLIRDLLNAYLGALKQPRDDYACAIYLLLNLYIQSRFTPKVKKTFKFRIFENIYCTIEEGKKVGEFSDYPTRELTILLLSVLKGLSYNRINLGHKNCIIPRSEIIMKMILKEEGRNA